MYTDSTGEPYNGPKFESIFEMGRRIYHAQIGIVSTAYVRAPELSLRHEIN